MAKKNGREILSISFQGGPSTVVPLGKLPPEVVDGFDIRLFGRVLPDGRGDRQMAPFSQHSLMCSDTLLGFPACLTSKRGGSPTAAAR